MSGSDEGDGKGGGLRRWSGPNHEGAGRAAPYALSRLGAPVDLVDMAAEITRADAALGAVTGGKLKVIVDQIRALQGKAEALLARAARDGELHRAACSFVKRPGKVYHLYRRPDGHPYFSMLAPDEWVLPEEQTFLGSYRLEGDQSWTALEELETRDEEDETVARLMARARLP